MVDEETSFHTLTLYKKIDTITMTMFIYIVIVIVVYFQLASALPFPCLSLTLLAPFVPGINALCSHRHYVHMQTI